MAEWGKGNREAESPLNRRSLQANLDTDLPLDTNLLFEDGQSLETYSWYLRLSSPVLQDALSLQQPGEDGKLRLPVSGDSHEGWKHVLQLISLHLPEPGGDDLTLANARLALPVAVKYSISRAIQRYAQHVQLALTPRMELTDAVQWLDLLCNVCKPTDSVITALLTRCKRHIKGKHGIHEAFAFLVQPSGQATETAARNSDINSNGGSATPSTSSVAVTTTASTTASSGGSSSSNGLGGSSNSSSGSSTPVIARCDLHPLAASSLLVMMTKLAGIDLTQPVPGTLVVESVARRGLAVERGPDWRWTEQDGGTGSVGVMVAPSTGFPGWWNVKWANGNDKYRYRIGAEGAYDLKVSSKSPPSTPPRQQQQPAASAHPLAQQAQAQPPAHAPAPPPAAPAGGDAQPALLAQAPALPLLQAPGQAHAGAEGALPPPQTAEAAAAAEQHAPHRAPQHRPRLWMPILGSVCTITLNAAACYSIVRRRPR